VRTPRDEFGPEHARILCTDPRVPPIHPSDRRGYLRRWGNAARRFAADPAAAVREIEALAHEVLVAHGDGDLTERVDADDPQRAMSHYDALLSRLLGFTR
jgi:hypothetical protein